MAAMVLSLPCLITGPFALIPLAMAVVAIVRISKTPDLEGKPLAVIAIVLSVFGLASTKLYIDAAENAVFMHSQTVVRSHAQGISIYVNKHANGRPKKEDWPDRLVEHGLIQKEFLISPREDGDGISYIFHEEYEDWNAESIMLYEDPKHWKQGVIVAFGDAHVEVIHIYHQFIQILNRHGPLVVMYIYKRILCFSYKCFWNFQGRNRFVFFNIHYV